jgi:hypothetical protein
MSTALARKFRIDVTSDLTLAGGWLQLNGLSDFSPNSKPNLVDASAYDTNGSASFEKTAEAWTATSTMLRRLATGVYDPGQELVRAATVGQFGNACRVGMRWYDKNGGPEAYQGVAIVEWARAGTKVQDLDTVTVTFTGTDVPLASITNPGVAATVPVILSALPTAIAVGGVVTITGSAFTGTVATSGVKFGATNATSWSLVSDNIIVAVMPAGTAGAANITVTNAVGVSTAFSYTRGA